MTNFINKIAQIGRDVQIGRLYNPKRNKIILITGLSLAIIIAVWAIVHFTGKPALTPVIMVDVNSADSIVVHHNNLVTPVIYTKVPDLSSLKVKARKKLFIHMMLPSILLAREKMATQRARVQEIVNNQKNGAVSEGDSLLLNDYVERFKAENPQDLLKRMEPHPVSIILAQAAIESGWGTSRFFKEANNVYGMWSYNSNEERIKAGQSRDGKNIYLRSYDTLFDSVYDYLYTIARSHAYADFRDARTESENPYRLIWFLSNYSEKRVGYVAQLRQMIEQNNLTRYDHYQLVEIDKKDENWKKLLES